MKPLLAALVLALPGICFARDLVVAIGADGEAAYRPVFRKEADAWRKTAAAAGWKVQDLGVTEKDSLQRTLDALPKDGEDLWLVLIGHGTFDSRTAKFNLQGDDVTSAELAAWLKPFQRRVVVWNLFSASGAFLRDLAAPNRIVICATRTGSERNYARFGEKLAESLDDPETDLDGDGLASITELAASADAKTRESYVNDQRIVVEHAVIDDNGDGQATEAAKLFPPKSGPKVDGAIASTVFLSGEGSTVELTAAQTNARDALEQKLAALRKKKSDMDETSYLAELEKILLELARLYPRQPADAAAR